MQDGRELPQNKYFYGIDLLRVIAIVNVVILHTLRRSGLIYSSTASQYNTAWLLETIAFFCGRYFWDNCRLCELFRQGKADKVFENCTALDSGGVLRVLCYCYHQIIHRCANRCIRHSHCSFTFAAGRILVFLCVCRNDAFLKSDKYCCKKHEQ